MTKADPAQRKHEQQELDIRLGVTSVSERALRLRPQWDQDFSQKLGRGP